MRQINVAIAFHSGTLTDHLWASLAAAPAQVTAA